MAVPRNSITDFEVANAPYALSEVSVHIANPDGSKGALATLYSALAGLATLPNPQTLDNTGKWQQPVYIDTDYILSINSPLDPLLDHDTGIVRYGGGWRGVWTGPGTRYNIDDLILGPAATAQESNVYRSQSVWTSTDWATDVADASKLVLELDYQALRALALAALPDAGEGVKGKIAIATQATTNTGTNDTEAVTPLKLASRTATETRSGIAEVATQSETNTGANDTTIVTPAKLHARVASETLQGLIAIATQTDVDTAANDTEAVTPTKLWTTPMRGGWRNFVGANGGFEIWQRGAGGAASITGQAISIYTADRWYHAGVAQAWTVSQQAGLVGGSRYCARIQRNNGQAGISAPLFGYPLDTDECALMRGKTVRISCKLRAGANWSPSSGAISVNFYTGTGAPAKRGLGAYTGEQQFGSLINLTPGGAVTDYLSSSIVVPDNITQAELFFFWTPTGVAGAADYFEVDDVVIEESPDPIFERRPFEDELRACMRHFQKSFAYGTAPAQNAGTANSFRWRNTATGAAATHGPMVPLSPPMRVESTATGTTYNTSAANAEVRNFTDTADCSATSIAQIGGRQAQINCTGNAGAAVNEQFMVHWTMDAGI